MAFYIVELYLLRKRQSENLTARRGFWKSSPIHKTTVFFLFYLEANYNIGGFCHTFTQTAVFFLLRKLWLIMIK